MAASYHDRVPSARVMSSRLLTIAIAMVVVACGSSPRRARRPGQEYLAKIVIEGNTALDSDTLIDGLSLHRAQQRGRGIDEYQLSLDVQRIESAYLRRGYLGVTVETRIEHEGDAATLIFAVTEGPRAKAIVEITGLPPEVSQAQARDVVGIKDGSRFDYVAYDEAKIPLLALVENAGYAHAELDASVLADRQHNTATVRYVFDTGPRVTLGPIEVVGTSGRLAEAVLEHAGIAEGDTYSAKAITDGQVAIYGIGRFRTVKIDVDRSGLATVVPVRITVVEAKRNELKLGGGAAVDGSTYQIRGRGSLTHKGFPSPLTTLGAEFRPALTALRDDCTWYEVWTCELDPLIRLLGTIEQRDAFVRGLNGSVVGGLDYLALEAYTMKGARIRTELDLPLLLQRFQLSLGWQLLGYNFTHLDDAIDDATAHRIGIDHFERAGAFTQGVSADFRDSPTNPRFGVFAELKVAEGSSLAGSLYDYTQLTPDLRGYLPLGRVVLAARVRYGVIRGDVPPTERYFAGGASSQRGFAERRLSPLARGFDDDGDPISVVIGGAASLETGLEARTTFTPGGYLLGIVAFLDGGDVTETPSELDIGHLHWAAGIGLRPYYTAAGPIRLDFAYRLNRTGPGEPSEGSHWNWHLSLGEAF
jgi:translocation and assembly module TamA